MRFLLFFLFLTVLPYLLGRPLVAGSGEERPSGAWCTGWLVMYALLYLPALLGIFFGWSLTGTASVWMAFMAVWAAGGWLLLRKRGSGRASLTGLIKEMTVFEWIALLLVVFHAVMVFRGMYVDDDDISYVGAAATSAYTNTVLKFDPATGNLLSNFHYIEVRKLVTAPLFVFYGALSRLFGIQTAALCHTWLPPVFTALFYGIFAMMGRALFPKERRKAGLFVILVFVIHMSSWYSVYNTGTFLMIRSWQGKAQVVGAVLPMILTVFLRETDRARMSRQGIFALGVTMAAAALMSSMGAVLASACVLLCGVIESIRKRSAAVLPRLLLTLLVPAASAVLYLTL